MPERYLELCNCYLEAAAESTEWVDLLPIVLVLASLAVLE